MKRLYGAMVLLALLAVTTPAKAVDCRVNGGAWTTVGGGQNINLQVPVNVRLDTNQNRIMLEGARLECRFTPSRFTPSWEIDYWRTGTTAWTPGPKFTQERTGLRINGTYQNTPVPLGILVATMPDNAIGYPIDVTPYIVMRNNPANPISIRIGDNLGVLRLVQTNNSGSGDSTLLSVTYTANNNFTVSPSTCTINNNNPIEVNFGTVAQRAIGTDPLTTPITQNRRLTYSCPGGGITSPITITYKGTPSSFNTRLLMMTNPDVGTAMVRGGNAIQVNGSFLTQITNSVGGDDVTFSLVRRANSLPAAGSITGSGVLVMGVP